MQKSRKNKKLRIRVVAAVLALAIIAPMPGIFSTNAAAATSLSGIEKIKSNRRFSILEIVPKEGTGSSTVSGDIGYTGSIGYYVNGYEPTATWLEDVGRISTPDARATYANSLFADLRAVDLMGDAGEELPLVQTGSYDECFPWEDTSGMKQVWLSYPETTTITGSFSKDSSGNFIKNSTFEWNTSGTHVEKALYYDYNIVSPYCYRVDFERVILDDSNVIQYAEKKTPFYVLKTDGAVPYYSYAGTLQENGSFTIDMDINNELNDPSKAQGFGYFVAKAHLEEHPEPASARVPSELKAVDFTTETVAIGTTLFVEEEEQYVPVLVHKDFVPVNGTSYYKLVTDGHSYSAVVNPEDAYRPAVEGEKGSFSELIGFRYVKNGSLDNVDYWGLKSGSDEYTVTYDTVFVTGGYTNNEWFKRYVLDIPSGDTSAFRLTVTSMTPEELNALTPTMLATTVSSYDLVVVSAGFHLDPNDTSTTYVKGGTIEYQTDISAAVANALSDKPRVVDTRISGNSSRLAQLKAGSTAPSVVSGDVDVYNFATGSDADKRSALATNQFHTKFEDTTPYAVVLEEIQYENQLRGNSGDLLDTDISMATCIRYIINTHRIINHKTKLRVLDIQPVARYDGSTGPLTVDRVLSWIPEDTLSQFGNGANITITHMSTAALIGKVENITEQYDLIYIGADVNTNNATDKSFLDKLPDGMYYSNIGDEETVSGYLAGLLDNDIMTDSPSVPDDERQSQTRYSGNDLTSKKQEELVAFADARMPIIVSDALFNSSAARPASELSVRITRDGAKLTATASLSNNITLEGNTLFQWYSTDDRTTPISYDESITLTSDSNGKTYYCTATVVVDDISYTAKSNEWKVTATAGEKKVEAKTTGNYIEWTCWNNITKKEDNGKNNWFNKKKIIPSIENNNVKLRADLGGRGFLHSADNPTYQWYEVIGENRSPVLPNGKSQELSLGTYNTSYYCCDITVTGYEKKDWKGYYDLTFTSPAYRVVSGDAVVTAAENQNTGSKVTIPAGTAGNPSLSTSKLDINSLMYKALKQFWNTKDEQGNKVYPNVMKESSVKRVTGQTNTEVNRNQNDLLFYLNLSRPSIEWYEDTDNDGNAGPAATPKEYIGTTISPANTYDCEGKLYFNFHIENPTDPNPLMAQYECKLYIDQNGDGRHTPEEEIGIDYIGRYVGDPDNGQTQMVPNGNLTAVDNNLDHITYTVQKGVDPEKFSGLVAWKLVVVKADDATAHASRMGFAYISPDTDSTDDTVARTKLRILQIATSNAFFGTTLSQYPDLSTPDENSNKNWQDVVKETGTANNLKAFQKLYYELYDAGMYDIEVDMERTSKFDGWTKDQVSEFLNGDDEGNPGYEMIILGFGDCYGELTPNAAAAVVEYIGLGKSVLFTHDTTSYWNQVGTNTEGALDGLVKLNSHPYWGYTFNTIVRDKVGLDRYGVTNATAIGYGLKLGTDGNISPAEATLLETAGYTPAYVPGEVSVPGASKSNSSGATQGLTNAIINQYKGKGKAAGDNPETSKVTRVNRGQITEFPYRLAENFTISTTHSQYYQLNMNAKDIVVWYCLSDDSGYKSDIFAEEFNDVTNAYYIYNRGNITYSGAGHTRTLGSTTSPTFEEKLFVNTMIAAYRAGNSAPTIDFKTADGEYDAPTLLIPTEFSQTTVNNVTTTTATIVGGNLDIYFMLQDTNLTADKRIAVQLYYDKVDSGIISGEYLADMNPIYRVDTGGVATANNLTSNILYRTTLPGEVLDEFAKHTGADNKKYNIYLNVITTLYPGTPNASTYSGRDNLALMKLGLLPLE